MGDYTWKPIEEVNIGDQVLGMNGTVNTVYALYNTKLGSHRVMYQLENLFFTGEHFFWIQDKGFEGWGVHNYNEYLWEMQYPELIPNHTDVVKPVPKAIFDKAIYATLAGWEELRAVVNRNFDSDSEVYSLRVTGDHTHYADRFVVEGLSNSKDCDYNKLRFASILGG